MGNFLSILAIFLVIPLGIATNLLTPKILNWYSIYSVNTREKRIEKLKHQLNMKREFLENTSKLLAYGLISILRILIFSTISALFLYILNVFHALTSITLIINDFVTVFVYTIVVSLNYLIAFIATSDLKIFSQVYKFEEYEVKVQKDIQGLENTISKKL